MNYMRLYFYSLIIIFTNIFSSCKFAEEDVVYSYTTAYFPYQEYNRNLVVGEGLKLNIGITFSGVLHNNQDRVFDYEIDPSLVPMGKKILPTHYYTCNNASQIVVPKGELKGYLTVELDSVLFLNDPRSLTGEYVIPIRLLPSDSADSIPPSKNHICVSISYYAKQYGNYTYSGKAIKENDDNYIENLYKNDPAVTNSFRLLQTVGPQRLKMVADPTDMLDPAKGTYSFLLDTPISGDGLVTLLPDPESTIQIIPVNESRYDIASKTYYLSYKYSLNDGTEFTVSDTLVFRNRIRDVQENGLYINEWGNWF